MVSKLDPLTSILLYQGKTTLCLAINKREGALSLPPLQRNVHVY